MANLVICERQELVDIADAIRANTSTTGQMSLNDMVGAINNIKNSDSDSSGGEEWFNDGNTHIWISLAEGRTSPMLGVGVKGTVTVDWGDGSEPDTLTGVSTTTAVYTPVHEYGKAGDYVITLSGGEVGVIGSYATGCRLLTNAESNPGLTRYAYNGSITKVELAPSVVVGEYAFNHCAALQDVLIPEGVRCVGSTGQYFATCASLQEVTLPSTFIFTWSKSGSFQECANLKKVILPSNSDSIPSDCFKSCYSLRQIVLPESIQMIYSGAFQSCHSLVSLAIPKNVSTIASSAFSLCCSLAYLDFSQHTSVPTLQSTGAFDRIAPDCQIRVPAALVDEWKAATNWATYAGYIVGV